MRFSTYFVGHLVWITEKFRGNYFSYPESCLNFELPLIVFQNAINSLDATLTIIKVTRFIKRVFAPIVLQIINQKSTAKFGQENFWNRMFVGQANCQKSKHSWWILFFCAFSFVQNKEFSAVWSLNWSFKEKDARARKTWYLIYPSQACFVENFLNPSSSGHNKQYLAIENHFFWIEGWSVAESMSVQISFDEFPPKMQKNREKSKKQMYNWHALSLSLVVSNSLWAFRKLQLLLSEVHLSLPCLKNRTFYEEEIEDRVWKSICSLLLFS